MNRLNHPKMLCWGLLLGFLWVLSCARYEIIDPRKSKRDTIPSTPSNVVDPNNNNNPPQPVNLQPSAEIEVMKDGVIVTKVHANQEVLIRPSIGTADPDDIGLSTACKYNPGIVRADYDLGIENKKLTSARSACEDLGVKYTFAKAGDYTLTMVVTSNDNENATSSMVLVVVDENTSLDDVDGGFIIHAHPMIVLIGTSITFEGRCDTIYENKITWNFADSKSGEGKTIAHLYEITGQFLVQATCSSRGKEKRASVTVVVVPKNTGNIPPTGWPPTGTNPGQTGQGQQPQQGCQQGSTSSCQNSSSAEDTTVTGEEDPFMDSVDSEDPNATGSDGTDEWWNNSGYNPYGDYSDYYSGY